MDHRIDNETLNKAIYTVITITWLGRVSERE